MNTVSFPNLGDISFTMNTTAFYIGDQGIAWYAIIIACGFLLAVMYALHRMKEFGLEEDRAMDAIIGGLIGGMIGARAYYVIFSWSMYEGDWSKIFNTRNGGLAFYGGLIGALLVASIICKVRHINLPAMFDVASLGFLIGQCIGRWGNFVNAEAFGTKTNSLFAMSINGADPVHPCFLYESLWCLAGFILLHLYSKHRKFDGEIILMYLSWYGLGRMCIEGLRTDSLYWGPFRVSQLLSGLLLVASFITLVIIRSNIKRNNDPDYLPLYVNTEESRWILEKAAELKKMSAKERKEYRQKIRAEEKETKAQRDLEKKSASLERKAKKLAQKEHAANWGGMTDSERAEAVAVIKERLLAEAQEKRKQKSKDSSADEAKKQPASEHETTAKPEASEEVKADESAEESKTEESQAEKSQAEESDKTASNEEQ